AGGGLRIESSRVLSETDNWYNADAGLWIVNSRVTISDTLFSGNGNDASDYGVYVSGNSTVTVTQSAIHDNAGYGLRNDGTRQVDGRSNWWGDPSGPGGEGPGRGDEVAGDVLYFPWLPSPDRSHRAVISLYDAGQIVRWRDVSWTSPDVTTVTVRVGNSAQPALFDVRWSEWVTATASPLNLASLSPSRYLQWVAYSDSLGDPGLSVAWDIFSYTVAGGDVTGSQVWTAANSPYVVITNVLVQPGASLLIEPGVQVWMADARKVMVDGTWVAMGTPAQPITFSSWHVRPQPGDWQAIQFRDTSPDAVFDSAGNYLRGSALQYVTVEYAGYTGAAGAIETIWSDASSSSAAPFVDHCTIRDSRAAGVWNDRGEEMRITHNTIDQSGSDGLFSSGESALLSGNVVTGSGGRGIANDGGSVTIRDNTIAGSGQQGLYSSGEATVIRGNTVTGSGHDGIHNYYGSYSQILDNVARGNAVSGIANSGGSVTIRSNTSEGNGRGVWNGGNTVTIEDNLLAGNTATGPGGGIYNSESGDNATIRGNAITSNTATTEGGGIWNNTWGILIIQDNLIRGNAASGLGGGLYTVNSDVTCQGNIIAGNSADDGGGIYWNGDGGRLSHNSITGNSADGSTGGLHVTGYFPIRYNDLHGNSGYTLYNNNASGGTNLDAQYNWWGTADNDTIKSLIYDAQEDSNKGLVDYEPYLTSGQPKIDASTKTAYPARPALNEPVTYTIVLSNSTPVVVDPLYLTDTLPVSVSYLAGSATGGATYVSATRTIAWQGAFGPYQQETIQFSVSISPNVAPGTHITNTAFVWGNGLSGRLALTAAFTNTGIALTGLTMAGPTEGIVGETYPFTVSASPPDAMQPITYTWELNTPPAGAALWLRLDEGGGATTFADDSSPAPHHGTCTGNGCPLSGQVGVYGNAAYFDGVDDIVNTTWTANDIVNSFTIAAWVKPAEPHEIDSQNTGGTDGMSGQRYLVSPSNGSNTWGDGHAGAGISAGTNGVSVYEHADLYMPSLLTWEGSLVEWTHIAVVYTDKQPALYVDGSLVKTGLTSPQAWVHPTTDNIGGGDYGYFAGLVDSVVVYDRALSAFEVSCLAAASTPISVVHTGGIVDTASFNWSEPGIHSMQVTADNTVRTRSVTHQIRIDAPPEGVSISGATTGIPGVDYVFTADTSPLTTTTPITYEWQASGHPPQSVVVGHSSSVTFTWSAAGAKFITVTAANGVGIVTATHVITIATPTRVGGNISSNTTWTQAASPYLLVNNVLVMQTARLTIEPGVTVLISDALGLQINGTLVARGTESLPITFSSWRGQRQKDDWGILFFNDSAADATFDAGGNYLQGSALQYVTVEYGGIGFVHGTLGRLDYVVDAISTTLYVDHCTIRHNGAGGVRSVGGVLSNNTISDNSFADSADVNGVGISNSGGGRVLYNSVTDNDASADYDHSTRGVGIYSVDGGRVLHNTVLRNAARAYANAEGIGIYNAGGQLSNNVVSYNSAHDIAGDVEGIGLYSLGGLVFSNTVTSNSSDSIAGSAHGGGIRGVDGATITHNRVLGNQAASAWEAWGGGICGSDGGEVTHNTVAGNAAYSHDASANGGGIHGSDVTLQHNTVTSNTAYARYNAYGGGLSAWGPYTVSHNTVAGNLAYYEDSASGQAMGGGLYAVGGAIVENNELRSNRVEGTGAAGGGMYSSDSTVRGNSITGNTAQGTAGGLLWASGSGELAYNTIAGNTSLSNTGGIYLQAGYPLLNHNAFDANSGYALYNHNQASNDWLDARYNWWGTDDEPTLQALVYDWFDNLSLGFVGYAPYLLGPPNLDPLGIDVSGRTEGLINTAYEFNASVYPIAAVKPLTFTWQASGIGMPEVLITHTVNSLYDAASLSWSTPGTKTITITASNPYGTAVVTHTVILASPFSSDAYETDDACAQARDITTDGATQFHTFHAAGDVDWAVFTATAGARYIVEATTPDDSSADVRLELYDSCSDTQADPADNSFGPDSSLIFDAPADGALYLRLANDALPDQAGGSAASYYLSVRELSQTTRPGVVVVVAGKRKEDDPLQANMVNVTNAVYRLFAANGYDRDHIYYLAPDATLDADGDLTPDVDALSSKSNLQDAITTWARDNLASGQPFTLYLMDHGGYDVFYLNFYPTVGPDVVTPLELDAWLDTLEAAVPDVKINVILEACHSGSFINEFPQAISTPGRVVIASTGAWPVAYASASGAAFSDAFVAALGRGMSLHSSFAEARWSLQQAHPDQTPWLDDNGNGVPNELEDGQVAALRGFAYAGTFDDVEWPPYIIWASVDQPSSLIQAEVQVASGRVISEVWALLYAPSYQPPETSEEMEVEDVPRVTLTDPDGDGVYDAVTGEFVEQGDYRVVVYATDSSGLGARPRQAERPTTASVARPVGEPGLYSFGQAQARVYLTDTGTLSAITITLVYTYPTAPDEFGRRPLPRRYEVEGNGSGFAGMLALAYSDRDLDMASIGDENALQLYRYVGGGIWQAYPSVVDTAANIVTATHVMTFSTWAIGAPGNEPTAVGISGFGFQVSGFRLRWPCLGLAVALAGVGVWRTLGKRGRAR
ncbi:MAG: right-handed parallel beta-helix repeat-containing protein, partial [Thermoflexales bacterium]|nr:right-handed parallel beta-helix repeat-containing protein [Thermoflexales bacterium]